MAERYIGLISGTSVDGVDAVIAEFADRSCRIIDAATTPFPDSLRTRIQALIERPSTDLAALGTTDVETGRFFAECAIALIRRAGLDASTITAIGHHGQTVFHQPNGPTPFTLQIGDPNVIVARTGITTVADFRRLDIALGGQGAPLAPAFHEWLFRSATEARVIVNLGGIANVTLLVPGAAVTGFDTGPANTLSDLWIRRCRGMPYDDAGQWAASGVVVAELLERMLADPYFSVTAPKSTGRERFNADWLAEHLSALARVPVDENVQATLVELTALTVARAISASSPGCRVICCGGGAHNTHLMRRLGAALGYEIETTDAYGIGVDWIEALAFAWYARARLRHRASSAPSVTGARECASLGSIYLSTARQEIAGPSEFDA